MVETSELGEYRTDKPNICEKEKRKICTCQRKSNFSAVSLLFGFLAALSSMAYGIFVLTLPLFFLLLAAFIALPSNAGICLYLQIS